VCVEATYLLNTLTTMKEVETSVQGEECHLHLKWHCCMWVPLNKGLGLTSQYPLQWLWKRSHPLFVCPLLCPSCDRNILVCASATFYCHIPVHWSYLSKQVLSQNFHSRGMWHHISGWLLTDESRQCVGLNFIDQNVQSNWTFWPVTQWCGTTSQKNTDLNYITAEA